MHTNFEETPPEWKRELREVCAALYRITLLDQTGRIRYSATGTDPEALADEAQEWLAAIGAQATSTERSRMTRATSELRKVLERERP